MKKIEIVVIDEQVEKIVDAIRIRTGESGVDAL